MGTTLKFNLFIVIVCIFVLALSFVLSISQDNRVVFGSICVASMCHFKNIFGIDCPTCGLTRSFIMISSLHFKRSLKYNRSGILVYIYVIFQIPYRLYLVLNKQKNDDLYHLHKIHRTGFYLILFSLILNWSFNFVWSVT